MVAVCDTELIGKSFEDNELILKITESFYKGEEATENEVVHSLKQNREFSYAVLTIIPLNRL
jgi:hypothetical protein